MTQLDSYHIDESTPHETEIDKAFNLWKLSETLFDNPMVDAMQLPNLVHVAHNLCANQEIANSEVELLNTDEIIYFRQTYLNIPQSKYSIEQILCFLTELESLSEKDTFF